MNELKIVKCVLFTQLPGTMRCVKSLTSAPTQQKQNVRAVYVGARWIQNTKKDTVFLDKWVCMIVVMFF